MTDTRTLKNFVGGEHADTAEGRTYDLVNPATGEVFAQAPLSSEEDVDRAFGRRRGPSSRGATRRPRRGSSPCSGSPTP